ncbi:MAG: DUF2062 domain-containing protein [Desulfobacterales bacterium]|nr:DUF2062 domain-containing protein [Desulfobacterales bacterium]
MNYQRELKYIYLRFLRLRGHPHDLALGMALGVFAGMMPILPFQTALALALALFFKGSKIAAALGTWVSNPFNWYFLYIYCYKIGAWILGITEKHKMFHSIMTSIHEREGAMVILEKIASAGGAMTAAFLVGGLILGIASAVPAYFIFLRFFRWVKAWRDKRRTHKHWRIPQT